MRLRDSFDVTGSCNELHFFTQGHSEIQYLSSKSISDGDNEGDKFRCDLNGIENN